MRKISSPPEFDSRTVQPVGIRYTTALSRPKFMTLIVGEIVIVQYVTRGVILGHIASGYSVQVRGKCAGMGVAYSAVQSVRDKRYSMHMSSGLATVTPLL
jgi:hypothetical protein